VLNPLTHRKILKKGTPGRATIVSASVPARGASSFNMAMTLQVYVEGMTPYEVEDQWMVKSRDTEALGGSIPVKVDPEDSSRVAIDWDALRDEHEQQEAQRRAALAAQGPVTDPDAAAGGLLGALGLGASMGGMDNVQVSTTEVDARNDPELRAKLQEVLGYELTPGQEIRVEDPALQARIMQVVTAHYAQKKDGATATPTPTPTPAQATPTPAAAPEADPGDDADELLSRLERLTALRDAGALTPEEFAETKQKLLDAG